MPPISFSAPAAQTYITFLFDCGFVWVVMVPLAYVLSRFVHMDILPLYFLCQSTNMLKALLGYTFLRQGKWIQNLALDQMRRTP